MVLFNQQAARLPGSDIVISAWILDRNLADLHQAAVLYRLCRRSARPPDAPARAAARWCMRCRWRCSARRGAFYGNVGSAVTDGWSYLPVYRRPDDRAADSRAGAAQDAADCQAAEHDLDRRFHRRALRQVAGPGGAGSRHRAAGGAAVYRAAARRADDVVQHDRARAYSQPRLRPIACRPGPIPACMWPSPWPCSRSSSVPATSIRANRIRASSARSRSNPSSSSAAFLHRRPVRDLRHVRRPARSVRPGADSSRISSICSTTPLITPRFVTTRGPGDRRDALPASPVPCRRGREYRYPRSEHRALAVSALSVPDVAVRGAAGRGGSDHFRRQTRSIRIALFLPCRWHAGMPIGWR